MISGHAGLLLWLVAAPRASGLLGTPTPPAEATPEAVEGVLRPAITFSLEPTVATQDGEEDWRRLARVVAGLQQLECTEDVVGAQISMLTAAEQGDALAMAALGSMFVLGQDCARKRNLTWGMHWLSRAVELAQPDAQALMGFFKMSDALRDLYNYTGVEHDRAGGLKLLEKAASGGSVFANLAMGYRYAMGVGVPESCPASGAFYEAAALAATRWLDERRQRSVEQSNPVEADHLTLLARRMPEREPMDAANVEYIDYCAHIGDLQGMVGMGHLWHAGQHGVPRDEGAALHWFRAAARAGEPMGHANYGLMQMRARRYGTALRALRRAAKLQDPSGWAGLSYAYLYGLGVPKSDALAARSMCAAAKIGHLDSIYNMGVLSLQGRGMPQSVRKAFHCFSVAAEFSHPHAQVHVGRMALRGLGVRKNCQTAQFFLKHAAEQGGLVRSLMSTALAAHEAKRPQRALMHYLLAAHAGVEAAQHNAGFLYAHDDRSLYDADVVAEGDAEQAALFRKKAMLYFQQAAVQGSVEAQVQLAVLLAEQQPPDHKLANKLFLESAQAGSRDALWHLGYHYLHGRGVVPDTQRAWDYMSQAGFHSKHARIGGAEALAFRAARAVYEARALLLVGAAIGALAASGRVADPLAMLRSAVGGLGGGMPAPDDAWEEENDFDDFSDPADEAEE